MPGPGLISDHLAGLAEQLPKQIVEELADGLGHTHRRYLTQGLDPGAAAEAAIAEFGEPQVIVAAFIRASPARYTARRLLAAGPVVGACWAAALVTGRAWTWPIPAAAPFLLGAALLFVIGLLAVAIRGRQYGSVVRAGTAGCAGIAALDIAMLTAAALAAPAMTWPVILAMAASAARVAFSAGAIRRFLAG